MTRSKIRRLCAGAVLLSTVGVVAFTTGLLRPVDDSRLFDRAEQDARACVEDGGHSYPVDGLPLGDVQSDSARRSAYDSCWTRVATDPDYASLKIPTPSALLRQSRADGFRLWRCVERSGYRRVTPIPLNAPNGYPLIPASRHFAVRGTQSALRGFYDTVAQCDGDLDMASFRRADGTFADKTADGERCERHAHSGDRHSHGCFFVNAYPEDL